MDIKQELKYVINKHKDDKLKTFQTDIVAMAEACLREIEGLHATCLKLAEYEDIGLEPYEIQTLLGRLEKYEWKYGSAGRAMDYAEYAGNI